MAQVKASHQVNTDAYPGEGLVEEEQTITERLSEPSKRLDESLLDEPISRLPYVPSVIVGPKTTVSDAIVQMREHKVGCVLVRQEQTITGIFTERDLLNRVIGPRLDLEQTLVESVMTPDPETLVVDAPIAFALNLMGEGAFRRLPLVDDNGQPVGLLSVKHIVQYLAEFFSEEVLTLPPRPTLLHPGQREGA